MLSAEIARRPIMSGDMNPCPQPGQTQALKRDLIKMLKSNVYFVLSSKTSDILVGLSSGMHEFFLFFPCGFVTSVVSDPGYLKNR